MFAPPRVVAATSPPLNAPRDTSYVLVTTRVVRNPSCGTELVPMFRPSSVTAFASERSPATENAAAVRKQDGVAPARVGGGPACDLRFERQRFDDRAGDRGAVLVGDGAGQDVGGGTDLAVQEAGEDKEEEAQGGGRAAHYRDTVRREAPLRHATRDATSAQSQKPAPVDWSGLRMRRWRRSSLPPPRTGSTIDADRLNDRVRDGNGPGPVALVASKGKDECVLSWWWAITPSFGQRRDQATRAISTARLKPSPPLHP